MEKLDVSVDQIYSMIIDNGSNVVKAGQLIRDKQQAEQTTTTATGEEWIYVHLHKGAVEEPDDGDFGEDEETCVKRLTVFFVN